MNFGFVKVAAAVPELRVADCRFNTDKIAELIREAYRAGAQIVVFPELSITAYTCGDLFQQQILPDEAARQLETLAQSAKEYDILALVGLPVLLDNQLFNCAAVIQNGEILGVVPKTYIPGYMEFYEERWFASGIKATSGSVELFGKKAPFGVDLLFEAQNESNVCFGIELCEDLWTPAPPSSFQAVAGATILFNLSASNEIIGKCEYRRELVKQQSGRCIAGYVYTSAGVYESTTDVVYGGHAIIAENGGILCESERFARTGSMIVSEIDIQRLRNDRIKSTSFMETAPGRSFRRIGFRLRQIKLSAEAMRGDEVPDNQGLQVWNRGSSRYAVQIEDTAMDNRAQQIEGNIRGLGDGTDGGMNSGIYGSMDGSTGGMNNSVNSGSNGAIESGVNGSRYGNVYTLTRRVDPHPFVPSDPTVRDARCREIFAIQTAGLAKRLVHAGMQRAVVGISGGLDSTLALIVTAKTFDMLDMPRDRIIAVTMPGFGTTDVTYANALQLIRTIGAELREVDIRQACLQHFADIGHDPSVHDVTYENVQARERTQILMDIANKQNGLVIGTGDLSELALGWCTYNGDHMSMYAVNCGIPKTLVKYLVRWTADNVAEKEAAEVLLRILDTPITPELLPPDEGGNICQKTEDIVGPYELHDFFLYHTVRYGAPPRKVLFLARHAFGTVYGPDEIKYWLKVFYKRFFAQQFKRSCLPDGPKVGTISLSPRGDWRMPSDAAPELWLRELEE